MTDNNVAEMDYEREGYLSLWLRKTASEDILFQYVEIDYEDDIYSWF